MTLIRQIKERTRSVRSTVSDAEWQARVDLAACYRLLALYGMTDLIYNHVTLRVPDHPEHFLINAYGMLYEEITASSLYKIDLEGNVILRPDNDFELNETGYVIHSAIHGARHDVACIIHTHTPSGMAVSAMECGLLPLTQTALRFHDDLAYHDYEGLALILDERDRLVRDLGSCNSMILRNHGLLTCGRSAAQALNLMYFLERACEAQVRAMATGTALRLIAPEISENFLPKDDSGGKRKAGEPILEWEAMKRKLDRIDESYAV